MPKPADPLAIAFCPGCLSRISPRFRICATCGYAFAHKPLTIREMLDGREYLYGSGQELYNHVNLPAFVRLVVTHVQAAGREAAHE